MNLLKDMPHRVRIEPDSRISQKTHILPLRQKNKRYRNETIPTEAR